MKKVCFYVICFFCLCSLSSQAQVDSIKIVLHAKSEYGGKEVFIYEDTSSYYLSSITSKVYGSKKIKLSKVAKEALPEGEYIIYFYKNGKLDKLISVSSYSSVYDMDKKCYLKCDVLYNIYEIIAKKYLDKEYKR